MSNRSGLGELTTLIDNFVCPNCKGDGFTIDRDTNGDPEQCQCHCQEYLADALIAKYPGIFLEELEEKEIATMVFECNRGYVDIRKSKKLIERIVNRFGVDRSKFVSREEVVGEINKLMNDNSGLGRLRALMKIKDFVEGK